MKTCCNRVHQNEVVLGFGRFFTPPPKKKALITNFTLRFLLTAGVEKRLKDTFCYGI